MNSVLIKPVITERSMVSAQNSKFTFVVARKAKKDEVKKAVEKKFNVHVVSITTTVMKGKTTRIGKRREEVKQAEYKKAIVTLQSGEKISLFEAVA